MTFHSSVLPTNSCNLQKSGNSHIIIQKKLPEKFRKLDMFYLNKSLDADVAHEVQRVLVEEFLVVNVADMSCMRHNDQ